MIKRFKALERKIPIIGCIILLISLVGFFNSIGVANRTNLRFMRLKPGYAHTTVNREVKSQLQSGDKLGSVDMYRKPVENQVEFIKATATPEIRHIAFLKVHKAASTTLQTMFYRFGYNRNLTFVLPRKGHYFSKSPSGHEPLIPHRHSDHYDIICNHGYFNYSIYSSLLPKDAVYIAVVRDPWSQFVSAFNYYSSMYHFPYLEKIPGNKLENLIRYPQLYEEGRLSYTMNSMAKDFGFTIKHYYEVSSGRTPKLTKDYLNTLSKTFNFVLIKEYMDESIILMKRILGWSLKDILYISKNVNSPEMKINDNLMAIFKTRNKLDYLIYELFYQKFQTEAEKHGEDLYLETFNYKQVLVRIQNWCFDQYFGELNIEATKWNGQFSVTSLDCKLMSKPEMEFIDLLKDKAGKH